MSTANNPSSIKPQGDERTAAWASVMNVGRERLQGGKLREAEAAYLRATQILPLRPESWVNLGAVQLQLDKRAAAQQSLANALKVHPKYPPAHSGMGDVQRTLGNLEGAKTFYSNAVSLKPDAMTLNKLATLIRSMGQGEQAEKLYLQAEKMAPNFTLPRVNRAILQIELGRMERAQQQLEQLMQMKLSAEERQHVSSALISLKARSYLMEPISRLMDSEDLAAFRVAVENTPEEQLQIDSSALAPIAHWAQQAQKLAGKYQALALQSLPEDWDQIEAAHMIPLVDSAASFRATQAEPAIWNGTQLQRRQTENMVPAIQAARQHYAMLDDPIGSEVLIRYLHMLSTRSVSLNGLFPGHFKYTQSRTLGHPTARHVIPSKAAGTWRHAIEHHVAPLSPGLERAGLLFVTMASIHPFADGNGRIGLNLMNRELVAAGLMPALFSNELGPQGLLAEAEEAAHTKGAMDKIFQTIVKGQEHAVAFLSALKQFDESAG